MQTALITGANRGIGYEVARQLVAAGYRVILTARKPEPGREAARSQGADFIELDVSSLDSIEQLAHTVGRDHPNGIHVLVNNAGVLLADSRPIIDVSAEEVEQTVRTNALGPFYLTQALAPHLRPNAQVIMVSSGAGTMCEGYSSYAPLYSASKTFMNALTRHLAASLAERKVWVNAVCPGWVRTDMGGPAANRSVEKGAETIVWLAVSNQETYGRFFRDKKEISW